MLTLTSYAMNFYYILVALFRATRPCAARTQNSALRFAALFSLYLPAKLMINRENPRTNKEALVKTDRVKKAYLM